jgi:V/A-type H+-transporting ATPase subunit I
MQRVAVVAPERLRRAVLVEVARSGMVEVDDAGVAYEGAPGPASKAVEHWRREEGAGLRTTPVPLLCAHPVTVTALVHEGRISELLGESEIEHVEAGMLKHGEVAAIAGWCPSEALGQVAERVRNAGGALVRIRPRRGVKEPTFLTPGTVGTAFQPLVDTYGTVPYRDIDPSPLTGIIYVAMFGMMFGDVGHGLLLLTAGLMVRAGRPAILSRLRRAAPFLIGAGIACILFGVMYGEAFGPTGLPPLWMHPLDHPTTLLAVAVAIGGALLAVSYVLGTINRWREAGAGFAVVSLSGIAGASLYMALVAVTGALILHRTWIALLGGTLLAAGVVLGLIGSLPAEGRGPGPWFQSSIEVFDATIRTFSNTVSFTRLAAFGLTGAALGQVIWSGATGLWNRSPSLWVPAALLFLLGNTLTFALEGLVAAIQALRLEYYEMFSRIFLSSGRQFRPWHVALAGEENSREDPTGSRPGASLTTKEASCSPGWSACRFWPQHRLARYGCSEAIRGGVCAFSKR